MTYWKSAAGTVLLTLSIAGAALAQGMPSSPAVSQSTSPVTKTTAPLPVTGDPAQTTATYGDWVMRCAHTGEGGTGPQTCEVVQTLVLQGQQQPIAEVAIGSIDKNSPLHLTVVVPTAISLSKAPYITGAPGTSFLFDLTWRRCLPSGCFADVQLNAESLKMLRARSEPANLVFRDAGERDVTLPFSMRGFPQSLDALQKETSAGK